jgi:uncharacterized membrane-anchored protein
VTAYNQFADSVVEARIILHHRIISNTEQIEWWQVFTYTSVNHRMFTSLEIKE